MINKINNKLRKSSEYFLYKLIDFVKIEDSFYSHNRFKTISPFSSSRPKTFYNKAGRTIFRGIYEGKNVKIYETNSIDHAQSIFSISKKMDHLFPEVYKTLSRYVVAEWVKSTDTRKINLDEMLKVQLEIHSTKVPSTLNAFGFDYWNDFILLRFCRAMEFFDEIDLLHEISGLVDEYRRGSGDYLMHPDITRRNIIVDDMGLKVIDNELLTLGQTPLFDVCNTLYSLDISERDEYLCAYLNATSTCLTEGIVSVLSSFWLARSVGSFFSSGNISEAFWLISQFKQHKNILPFDKEKCF